MMDEELSGTPVLDIVHAGGAYSCRKDKNAGQRDGQERDDMDNSLRGRIGIAGGLNVLLQTT